MSTQETRDRMASRAPEARARTAGPAAAPLSVKAAATLAVLAAASTIAYAVLALANGRSMLRDMANSLLAGQLGDARSMGLDLGPLIDDAVNSEYHVLQDRAYIGIVIALVYLALCTPIVRGARKLRIAGTVFLALPVIMAFADLGDDTPTVLHALDGVELACAVLTAVALWLPASNAYVRARRS
ncbi:hypothetical protein [Catenulispora subtropica]|uniref:Integral membrane protein n=1 Tax=Catenulispora subtropica TaxID=450798 RepID=A0ABN2TC21_9ACTN